MANHSIKIKGTFDGSGISSGIDTIRKQIDAAFGEKGKKVLDSENVSKISHEISSSFAKLTGTMQTLRKEHAAINKEIKKQTADEVRINELYKKRAENKANQIKTQRDLNALKKIEHSFSDRQTKIHGGMAENVIPAQNRFGSMAKKQLYTGVASASSSLPLVGEATHIGGNAMNAGKAASSAGLSLPATGALMGLAIAAGLAKVAIDHAAEAFGTFKQAIPNLLALSATGTSPANAETAEGIQKTYGFNTLETFENQRQLSQAFGTSKSEGAETGRLNSSFAASRALGISPDQISSGGQQLRAAGGTDAAQKQMGMILEKAIASGMDKSQSSSFLSSAVSLLSSINENGVTDGSQMLGVLADLTKRGVSGEQGSKSLMGLNNAISGSSGEANSFFQMSAAKGGLGGGTLLGTQFAVRQGLNPVNDKALGKFVGGSEEGQKAMTAIDQMKLNDPGYGKKFAGSILGETQRRFSGDTKESELGKMGFVNSMFGGKTAEDAAKILALLDKIAKGTSNKDDAKVLQDMAKGPDAVWQEKMLAGLDKLAINTQRTEANAINAQFELGKASAPIFNSLINTVASLDKTMAKFLVQKTEDVSKISNFFPTTPDLIHSPTAQNYSEWKKNNPDEDTPKNDTKVSNYPDIGPIMNDMRNEMRESNKHLKDIKHKGAPLMAPKTVRESSK